MIFLLTDGLILQDILQAISELQEQVTALYLPAGSGVWERKPWTIASGPQSIGDSLILQVNILYQHLLNLYLKYLAIIKSNVINHYTMLPKSNSFLNQLPKSILSLGFSTDKM